MSIPVGKFKYDCACNHRNKYIFAIGREWLKNPVHLTTKLFICTQFFNLIQLLKFRLIEHFLLRNQHVSTGFNLNRIKFHFPKSISRSKVGEALASAYLTTHYNCYFPWPTQHDARNFNASLPGADLVGFFEDRNGDCFAFGEVKTSRDRRSPPRVLDSLGVQLENLRKKKSIRENLILYMFLRINTFYCLTKFIRSLDRYLFDNSDYILYGFLVRDKQTNKNELQNLCHTLRSKRRGKTKIGLIALYVHRGFISNLIHFIKNFY